MLNLDISIFSNKLSFVHIPFIYPITIRKERIEKKECNYIHLFSSPSNKQIGREKKTIEEAVNFDNLVIHRKEKCHAQKQILWIQSTFLGQNLACNIRLFYTDHSSDVSSIE